MNVQIWCSLFHRHFNKNFDQRVLLNLFWNMFPYKTSYASTYCLCHFPRSIASRIVVFLLLAWLILARGAVVQVGLPARMVMLFSDRMIHPHWLHQPMIFEQAMLSTDLRKIGKHFLPSWTWMRNGLFFFLGLGCFELNPVTKRLFSMS